MFLFIVICVFLALIFSNTRAMPESSTTLSIEEEALLRKDGIDPTGRRNWSEILEK